MPKKRKGKAWNHCIWLPKISNRKMPKIRMSRKDAQPVLPYGAAIIYFDGMGAQQDAATKNDAKIGQWPRFRNQKASTIQRLTTEMCSWKCTGPRSAQIAKTLDCIRTQHKNWMMPIAHLETRRLSEVKREAEWSQRRHVLYPSLCFFHAYTCRAYHKNRYHTKLSKKILRHWISTYRILHERQVDVYLNCITFFWPP